MASSISSHDKIYIRCFDLGGSGLKTALLRYNKSTHSLTLKSPMVQLGKCPDDRKVAEWVRTKMEELSKVILDEEIQKGHIFAFSLAGLNKLREKPVKTLELPILFDLPDAKTRSIDDGTAHLLSSLKALKDSLPKTGCVWNFSIGTAIGFGFTNSKQEIKPASEIRNFFGQDSWTVQEPTTGKPNWEACGSTAGFDKIVADREGKVDKEAFEIFAGRWKAFIHEKIIALTA